MDMYTELQILKEEERALMNISSRMSDQLNRLKVEELALLSQLHNQGDDPRSALVSPATTECSRDAEPEESEEDNEEDINAEPLLDLGLAVKQQQDAIEEEEEEDGDEMELGGAHDQLTAFIQHMENTTPDQT